MAKQTKNVMLGIRVPEDLERRIRYVANEEGMYVSEIVRSLLEDQFSEGPMARRKRQKRSLI